MKKVLIITYYWPPAGGPGVQRWLKFVKYLPDFGISPIVYIPDNPTYPIIDKNLGNEVSPDTVIIKRRIFEPYGLASMFSRDKIRKMSSGIIQNRQKQGFVEKISLWIRGNLFIPDARVFWVRPSVSFLEKYLKENAVDTIITSGPPHSLHLIGLKLKKKMDVTWIADFRDPWTTIGYHKDLKLSESSQDKHKDLERLVLNTADKIIVTSKSTRQDFRQITAAPVEIITNGYDIEETRPIIADTKFSLAHIGSMLSERNPILLWNVLNELLYEIEDFSKHLELKFLGMVSREVLESVALYKLDNYVNNMGYVSHKEAIAQQRSSQVLLLVEINSLHNRSIIPGKLFEYMVSGRPIVAIGPRGSDIAEIIQSTNTGVFVDYSAKEQLKQAIRDYYKKFLEGALQSQPIGLQQYARRNLTQKLADLLK